MPGSESITWEVMFAEFSAARDEVEGNQSEKAGLHFPKGGGGGIGGEECFECEFGEGDVYRRTKKRWFVLMKAGSEFSRPTATDRSLIS
jgi:hypothetical protein